MNLNDEQLAEMLAYESFIRRASGLNMPFMLKGSYVTRQYFPDPRQRVPADLDWLYLEKLNDPETARSVFSKWVTLITELKTDDGVEFMSFSENAFWRMIDYAMHDDFPTVNTDLACRVDQHEIHSLALDISFNLPVGFPPVPLLYKPLRGEPFTIPYTVPLCLQVSWKIHQTLVRPRFKDLFDLIYLLQHVSFNEETWKQSIEALIYEANKDQVDLIRFYHFLSGHMDVLFEREIHAMWDAWRNDMHSAAVHHLFIDSAKEITDVGRLPYNLSEFLDNFYAVLKRVGFKPSLINASFEEKWNKRTGYNLHLNKKKSERGERNTESSKQALENQTPVSIGHPEDKTEISNEKPRNGLLARLGKLFRPKK